MMRQPSASSTNLAPEFHHPGPGGPPGPPPHYDGSNFLLDIFIITM
jgi:polyadenylation factor subunit 2